MVRHVLLTLCFALSIGSAGKAEPLAKELFGAKFKASAQQSSPVGSYAKGCLAGAKQLPESGPTWQAMRLSRNRNWGHPDTINFIERLSRFAANQIGWNGLYVGDISQPRGGPMLTGHRSHQVGLDIDFWMKPTERLDLSRAERESISSVSMQRAKGAYVNKSWSRQHHAILRAAAKDKAVARIFVFPGAKVKMCKNEKGDRRWLGKIRPWWGHHYHFHVRLACPKEAKNCTNQAPPPAGDGCVAAENWVADILNPPSRNPDAPPPKPRREYVMSDLPKQCARVLSR